MRNERVLREELRWWDPARDSREPDPETARWLRARVLATAAEAEKRSPRASGLALALTGAVGALLLALGLSLWLGRPAVRPEPEVARTVPVVDPRTFEAAAPLSVPEAHRPPEWRAPAAALDVTTVTRPSSETLTAQERREAPRRRFEMRGRGGTRLIWSIEPNATGDLGVTD
jgi:hypothetical protein